jgi:hypothetical protein
MTDSIWTHNGTRTVKGKAGTVISFSDGSDEVLFCDPSGFLVLQIAFADGLCGTITVTFDSPVILLASGDTAGTVRVINTGADVVCAAAGTYRSTITGSVTVERIHGAYPVSLAIFPDVAEVAIYGTGSAAGRMFVLDQTVWLARDVGPVAYLSRATGQSGDLAGGTVCGLSIQPGPTPTPTPSPGDMNRDGKIDGRDLFLFLRDWHRSGSP